MLRREIFTIFPIIAAMLFFGTADAKAAGDDNSKQVPSNRTIKNLVGTPQLVLYYASVACSCTMARCQAAMALCDLMLADDTTRVYRTVDVYTDTLAADSVAVWEVPALVLFDGTGHEKGRIERDITVEDVRLLLEEGGDR